jgi:hypothetical protein
VRLEVHPSEAIYKTHAAKLPSTHSLLFGELEEAWKLIGTRALQLRRRDFRGYQGITRASAGFIKIKLESGIVKIEISWKIKLITCLEPLRIFLRLMASVDGKISMPRNKK